jgi:hypothetical protein
VRRLSGVVSVLEGLSGTEQVLASVKALLLEPLKERTTEMSKFVDMVEQTLDTQQAAQGEFLIRPEFDDNLKGRDKITDTLKRNSEEIEVNFKNPSKIIASCDHKEVFASYKHANLKIPLILLV